MQQGPALRRRPDPRPAGRRTMAGSVSGSFSSHEWRPRGSPRAGRWPPGGRPGGGERHGEVPVAVDHEEWTRRSSASGLEQVPARRRAQDRDGRADQAPRPADVADGGGQRRGGSSLAAWRGSRSTARCVSGVDHQRRPETARTRRRPAGPVDHAVPGVAHDGVEQEHGDGPLGCRAASSITAGRPSSARRGPPARMPELVEDPAEQRGVVRQAGAAGRAGPGCRRGRRCRWRRP